MNPHQYIDKIYFMVHPITYAEPYEKILSQRPDLDERHLKWFWEREREVRPKQDALIRNLGEHEALVLYPIGPKAIMSQIEAFARCRLGSRCIVLPTGRSILGSIGRGAWAHIEEKIKAEIADDIARMVARYMYDWQSREVKTIILSRLYADYITRGFHDANLQFDPQKVKAEAFGESFDGCVTTWTNMTASYLGLANPVEKNYELSVPDLAFLMTADFVERISLGNHISLYLWEDADGAPIGLFAKGSYRSFDPRFFAVFPLDGWHVSVKTSLDREVWPIGGEQNPAVRLEEGNIHVPVHTGSRRNALKQGPAAVIDTAHCIFGHAVSMNDFRERLTQAKIVAVV